MQRELLEAAQIAVLDKEGSGFRRMLCDHQFDALRRVFDVFVLVDVEPMAQLFREFVKEMGTAIVECRRVRVGGSADGAGDPAGVVGGVDAAGDSQFVSEFVELYKLVTRLEGVEFRGSSAMHIAARGSMEICARQQVGDCSNEQVCWRAPFEEFARG